ncbi:hypothetical protein K491DRAFT_605768 [Lophiostoma macrostomum CBS 122681]|uniref:DUF7918 domain-containing protein n=1 Tax=Lophiostoma macrostomum CBS 122681 TaxID=1314788 RepID=A0A6A6SW97_9PLEO|nr:hypothetical protein K491DRAFT_605768 [Lophiostoma macrostomum CBS 122681]
MPTYRGINIELHSQYDIETLPEYYPPSQEYCDRNGVDAQVPALVDDATSTCSVYVPVFPGSQFWINYSVSPPVPEDQQFLFKLFINEEHIVSWSCSKDEEWKGKTMFGLYEKDDEGGGRKRIEKRVFCFTPPDRRDGEWKDVTDPFDMQACVEICVHRAHARKRIAREVEQYASTPHAREPRGINLVNAGRVGVDQPKRFYKFALIDPTDQPFARFRYFYRTWEQLENVGVLGNEEQGEDEDEDEDESKDSEVPVKETAVPDPEKRPKDRVQLRGGDHEDVFTNVSLSDNEDCAASTPQAYVPSGARGRKGDEPYKSKEQELPKSDRATPRSYRLSVPPSLRLDPPHPQPDKDLPSIPPKSEPFSPTGYRPHPAYPVEDWVARTPSPVKSLRDGISTPQLGRRRAFTASSLINVVTSAWKRRGTPSSEVSNESSRTGSRNVS